MYCLKLADLFSASLATQWIGNWGLSIAWLLLPGPMLGLLGLFPLWRRPAG